MGNPLNLAKIDAEIAAQLDSKLGESSMSLRQLSEKSGVKLTRLGDVLRRGRPMTVGELEAISRTLGLIGWRVMRQAEDALEETESTSRDVVEVDPLSDLLPQEIYGLTPPDPDDYGVYAQRGDVEAEQEASQEMP